MSPPEPSRPEPSPPEPSRPEPSRPEPSPPEPSTPEPSTPEPSTPEPSRPEPSLVRRDLAAYGTDAPRAVKRIALIGGGFTLLMVAGALASSVVVMAVALFAAFTAGVVGLALVWSSRVGKLRERVQIVDDLELTPADRVLDIGCGRGLLTVEAARRLDAGVAIGVDLWREEGDPSAVPTLLWDNAAIEGVDDRVEVTVGDARSLPLPDESFDVVVSASTFRALGDKGVREQAIGEVARVVRPGGRVAIVDTRHTKAYAAALRSLGWSVTRSKRSWAMFPPVRTVTATRPTT